MSAVFGYFLLEEVEYSYQDVFTQTSLVMHYTEITMKKIQQLYTQWIATTQLTQEALG